MHITKNDNSSCNILTDDANVLNAWEIKNTNKTNEFLDIKLSSGESCAPGKTYSINLQLQCDKTGKSGIINFTNMDKFNPTSCENIITAKTLNACPKYNHYVIFTFLYRYFYVFGTILILIGLYELILGKKVLLGTQFIIPFLALSSITLFILISFITGEDILWLWAVFGGALLLAAPLGWLFYKYVIVFYIFLGAYSGFATGVFVYYLFFTSIIVEHSVNK